MAASEHLVIFDTTLRDGEQSPGATMNKAEKLRIAKALEKLRVDVIEAGGFAIASQGDFDAVKAIARTSKNPLSAVWLVRWTRISTGPLKRSALPSAPVSIPLLPPRPSI